MTEVPVQTGFADGAIVKLTGRFGLTVTVCDAVFGPLQPVTFTVTVLVPLHPAE